MASPTTPETRLRDEVEEISNRLGIDESKAFAIWYGVVGLRLDEQDAIEAASYDGGNDRGIDLFCLDDDAERIIIAQMKYLLNSSKAPKASDLTLLFDVPSELEDPQELINDGRSDLAEIAEEVRDARSRGYVVQLHLVYPGSLKEDLERKSRQFNRRWTDGTMVQLVRLEDLELMHAEYHGTSGRVERDTLELVKGSHFEETGEYGRSLVATFHGRTLKQLWDRHGNKLFDQNVRLWLGARKGSVNAGIQETLRDASERPNFWAYNNGITIVAKSFSLDPDTGLVEVREFSVVNGCQTTVSIASEPDEVLDKVAVLGRIVAAHPGLVDNVIRYTNSQTPIAAWSLSARDKVQQRIKRELQELPEPWYYALRPGEFDALTTKDDFGPRGDRRVLTFPLSAQLLAAFRGLPVEAYKDKARLFSSHRERVFPIDLSINEVLWAWYVGQSAIRAIEKFRIETTPDETTEKILVRGGRFFVTSIASQLLRIRNGESFVHSVSLERFGDKALQERIDKYALNAVAYYVGIVHDMIESGADLSVLLRNTDTARRIFQRVETRMVSEKTAPKALEEKLPRLPGVRK